jgi:hypothetical protein
MEQPHEHSVTHSQHHVSSTLKSEIDVKVTYEGRKCEYTVSRP